MFQVATAGWGLIAVSTTKSDGACGIAAHPCTKRKDGAALGIVASSGTDSNHYKFTGKERDSESNLDNFGARYYTSNIGRFMTPDWAARATAVPYATFGDPQTLNLYTYVRNDPVSQADADGHQVGYRDATGTSCPACPSALQQIEDANDDRYNDEQEAKAEGQARAQQSGTAQNQVTFSDTKTTHSYDEK